MTTNTSIHPKRPVLDKFHTDDDAVTLALVNDTHVKSNFYAKNEPLLIFFLIKVVDMKGLI